MHSFPLYLKSRKHKIEKCCLLSPKKWSKTCKESNEQKYFSFTSTKVQFIVHLTTASLYGLPDQRNAAKFSYVNFCISQTWDKVTHVCCPGSSWNSACLTLPWQPDALLLTIEFFLNTIWIYLVHYRDIYGMPNHHWNARLKSIFTAHEMYIYSGITFFKSEL